MGERLARVRKHAEMRQHDFAKVHGVSISAYANYERGATPVPVGLLQEIAATYDINVEWFLFGVEGRELYAKSSNKGAK